MGDKQRIPRIRGKGFENAICEIGTIRRERLDRLL
jgi:hypothetical protein